MFDDDVRSELADPPALESGLAVTSAGSVMEQWFPVPGKSGDTLVELAPGDLVEPHETMLGRSLASLVGVDRARVRSPIGPGVPSARSSSKSDRAFGN